MRESARFQFPKSTPISRGGIIKTINNLIFSINISTKIQNQPADPYSEVDDDDEDPEDDIPLAALRLRVPFEEYASMDSQRQKLLVTTP